METLAHLAVFAVCAVFLLKQIKQVCDTTLLPYLRIGIYSTVPMAMVLAAIMPDAGKGSGFIQFLVCAAGLHFCYLFILRGRSLQLQQACYNAMGISCALSMLIGWAFLMLAPQNTFMKLIVYAFVSLPFWGPILIIRRREKRLREKLSANMAKPDTTTSQTD